MINNVNNSKNASYDYNLPDEVVKLLEDIKDVYGEKSAKYLEELTHSKEPWISTREDLPSEAKSTKPIDKQLIAKFYRDLHAQVNGN